MLFSFIGLCIAWIIDKKNRLLPYMNQRVIYPAPPVIPMIYQKKRTKKRRSQATLIVLFYYLVLFRRKNFAFFSVATLIRRSTVDFTT